MEKPNGYVYILTNPSFREDWVKIGKRNDEVFDYLPLQQTSTYELAVSIAKRTKLVNPRGEQISVWKTNGRTLELLDCWTIK